MLLVVSVVLATLRLEIEPPACAGGSGGAGSRGWREVVGAGNARGLGGFILPLALEMTVCDIVLVRTSVRHAAGDGFVKTW